jgi:hypothetical protein
MYFQAINGKFQPYSNNSLRLSVYLQFKQQANCTNWRKYLHCPFHLFRYLSIRTALDMTAEIFIYLTFWTFMSKGRSYLQLHCEDRSSDKLIWLVLQILQVRSRVQQQSRHTKMHMPSFGTQTHVTIEFQQLITSPHLYMHTISSTNNYFILLM